MSEQNQDNAGKKYKKTSSVGGIVLILLVGLVLWMCSNSNKNRNTSTSSSTTKATQTTNYSVDVRPDTQKKFEQIFIKYSAEFDKAGNELQESQARDSRKKEYQQLGLKTATDWIGTLKNLKTNSEGKAYIYIDLSEKNLTICTWNNSFSDSGDNTLIPMESELFKTLSTMKEGSKVKFSGTFITGSTMDHFDLSGALTIRSAMKNPDFVMKFSQVSAIGNKPITTSDINLREEASTESNKLITIPKGSEVKLLGNASEDDWIKISFENEEGYINKQYLTY